MILQGRGAAGGGADSSGSDLTCKAGSAQILSQTISLFPAQFRGVLDLRVAYEVAICASGQRYEAPDRGYAGRALGGTLSSQRHWVAGRRS